VTRQVETSRENVADETEASMHPERQEIYQVTEEVHPKFNAQTEASK